jgi:hypothetical protein
MENKAAVSLSTCSHLVALNLKGEKSINKGNQRRQRTHTPSSDVVRVYAKYWCIIFHPAADVLLSDHQSITQRNFVSDVAHIRSSDKKKQASLDKKVIEGIILLYDMI